MTEDHEGHESASRLSDLLKFIPAVFPPNTGAGSLPAQSMLDPATCDFPHPGIPEHWLYMPTTEIVEHNLGVARKGYAYLKSRPLAEIDVAIIKAWGSRVIYQEAEFVAACARDRHQAGRPPGCWCLGFGGRDLVSQAPVFCQACEDGALAKATHEDLWRHYQTQRMLLRKYEIERRLGLEAKELEYTLESFPLSPQTDGMIARVREWSSSLLLLGPPSTGKTGAAIATLHARCMRDVQGGFFITALRLLVEIRAGFSDGRRLVLEDEDIFSRVVHVPYLVLDDIGKENTSGWTIGVLFDLLDQRNRAQRSTIFTSNLSLAELRRRLGDSNMDRIIEMCDHGHGVIQLPRDTPNLRTNRGGGNVMRGEDR